MIGFDSLISKKNSEITYEDFIYLVHLQGYQRARNYYGSLDDQALSEIVRTKDY